MRLNLLLTFSLALLLGTGIADAQSTPEQIFVNGKILTADKRFSSAQAVAVSGERFAAVGTNEEIRKLAGKNTRVFDLRGKSVIPGLIDNHVHFVRHAANWNNEARLDGITSRKKALATISAKAKQLKPGEWVIVMGGWGPSQFRDKPGIFTRTELDLAAPDNPVFVQQSYRLFVLNSAGLIKAGIDKSTEDRQGEKIARDKNGKATGIISGRRGIFRFWRQVLPKTTPERILGGLKNLMADFNRAGVTSVVEFGGGGVRNSTYELIGEQLAKTGGLTARIFYTPRFRARSPEQNEGVVRMIKNSPPRKKTNNYFEMIALGEHMYAAVHDSPFRQSRATDEDYKEFSKVVAAAAEKGWQIHEHAFRDETISRYLDIFEEVNKRTPIGALRWSIHHADFISPKNIRRVKALGITLALHSKMTIMAPGLRQRLGKTALSLPPIRTIRDSGVLWGLGTDAGVVAPYPPMLTLWWVVTGKDLSGTRALSQTVSRKEALIAHTRSNAYLIFKEKDLGSIEAGKLADFVILDRNYMTAPADEIKNIRPLMTIVGGKVVFRSREFN